MIRSKVYPSTFLGCFRIAGEGPVTRFYPEGGSKLPRLETLTRDSVLLVDETD